MLIDKEIEEIRTPSYEISAKFQGVIGVTY